MNMNIYTIGFTKKKAKEFFDVLRKNKIEQLIDIRLNNTSQLAGFAKKDDLKYFLKELCGIDYFYFGFLAPTREIRNKYNKGKDWDLYVKEYMHLLETRDVLRKLNKSFFKKRSCLLCAEPTPEHCHRRLLAEYLKKYWRNVEAIHL